MPCSAAVIEKPLLFMPDVTIEKALADMKVRGADFAIVISEKGVFEGVFSYRELMRNLLPVSVAMADGIQLDITVRAAPGVAKRLRKVMPLPVSDFINRKPFFVYPQTPIWEGINALAVHGSPILVIEQESQKFMGAITDASALTELMRMQEEGNS